MLSVSSARVALFLGACVTLFACGSPRDRGGEDEEAFHGAFLESPYNDYDNCYDGSCYATSLIYFSRLPIDSCVGTEVSNVVVNTEEGGVYATLYASSTGEESLPSLTGTFYPAYTPGCMDEDLDERRCFSGTNHTGGGAYDYSSMYDETIVLSSANSTAATGRVNWGDGTSETFRLKTCDYYDFLGYGYGDDDDSAMREVNDSKSDRDSGAKLRGAKRATWKLRFR